MKKVLFVCTANVCRSPMAQELFNALAEDGGLPFRAESAGTAALEGRPMAQNSLAALEEAGIYPEGAHSARRVSAAMIGDSEVVLAMTPEHAATLRRIGGGPLGDPLGDPPRGIHVLPEYASGVTGGGVADPHGLTMAAHRSTLRQLYECVERVAHRLRGRALSPKAGAPLGSSASTEGATQALGFTPLTRGTQTPLRPPTGAPTLLAWLEAGAAPYVGERPYPSGPTIMRSTTRQAARPPTLRGRCPPVGQQNPSRRTARRSGWRLPRVYEAPAYAKTITRAGASNQPGKFGPSGPPPSGLVRMRARKKSKKTRRTARAAMAKITPARPAVRRRSRPRAR